MQTTSQPSVSEQLNTTKDQVSSIPQNTFSALSPPNPTKPSNNFNKIKFKSS
jgi:hypothetical protein